MAERMADTFGLLLAHEFFMKNKVADDSHDEGLLKKLNLTSEQVRKSGKWIALASGW
jgi:hypothetical protein